jgi:O-antigen/teichoic acid export membrane protein
MGAKLLIERASWTLVDQGVVSFGNFLLNVLLARTLSEEDYGEFTLFLGAIFILRTILFLHLLSAVGAPGRRERRGARSTTNRIGLHTG